MYSFDPGLRKIHLMAPDLAEECRHFLAQSFTDDSFEVNATVPSYTAWYEGGRHLETYRRHRRLLGLLGGTDPRRWVLKYPVHLKHLEALLAAYPDACIVQTHRDPTKVMASYVELIAGFRAIFEHDIDRAAIAREQLEVWAAGADRAIAVRAAHDPAQFHDVFFGDFIADPIAAVRGIYARFGLTLSDDGRAPDAGVAGRRSRRGPRASTPRRRRPRDSAGGDPRPFRGVSPPLRSPAGGAMSTPGPRAPRPRRAERARGRAAFATARRLLPSGVRNASTLAEHAHRGRACARGARLTDVSGNEYVDYLLGSGTALARPRAPGRRGGGRGTARAWDDLPPRERAGDPSRRGAGRARAVRRRP